MQGSQITKQPLEDSNGILLYNGDIFNDDLLQEQSDTQLIMDELNLNVGIYFYYLTNSTTLD